MAPTGPSLSNALRATTLESATRAGAHDVVVVGGGASGGLAALLLAEAGLRVLLLDAGMPQPTALPASRRATNALVRTLADPSNLRFLPPKLVPMARVGLRALGLLHQPVQSRCGFWGRAPELYVDDRDCPYVTPPDQPFVWIRTRQLGGKMTLPGHGRQYYRLGPADFASTGANGWPLERGELDAWYSQVEKRLKLAGGRNDIPWQPDSELERVLTPTANERGLMEAITSRWPGARPMLGCFAPPLDSLEAAAATGRLQCRQGAIAKRIDVDSSGRVSGVTWVDQLSGGREARVSAPLVFLCASALESTRLLLLSRSSKSPDGLGAASGALGRNLMDHMIVTGWCSGPALPPDHAAEEQRSIYLPRFDAREQAAPAAAPGFGVQLYQFPGAARESHFVVVTFGEMPPRPENRVTLDPSRRDAWGIPVLRIECGYDSNDLERARNQGTAIRELADALGVKLGRLNDRPTAPGVAIHECGSARMGADPSSSVLDPHNQCWDARGLYVTDGSSFASQGTQNPTLTILALTARACDHAVSGSR
ncbi:MAG: FAD-dependent oxidoreductase [Gammaproteobacteria bacterium]